MTLHGMLAQPAVLARVADISHQHASRLLSGQCTSKNWDLLDRLASAFHVSIRWMATGQGSPTPRAELLPDEAHLLEMIRNAHPGAKQAALDLFQSQDDM